MLVFTNVKPYIPWMLALAGLALAQQASDKKDSTTSTTDQKQSSSQLFGK